MFRIHIAAAALLLANTGITYHGRAETPDQIHKRLEEYRLREEEVKWRHQQHQEWQEKRRREEYQRRWKKYGSK